MVKKENDPMIDLAIKFSKCVHDNCKEVPHDIGITIIEVLKEWLKNDTIN